jgi:ketosteroid isomerase-like protein
MELKMTTAIVATAMMLVQAWPAGAQQAMSQQEAQHVAASALEAWNKAFAARDPAGLAAQYTEDYVENNPPPDGTTASGRAWMEKHWAANFEGGYSPDPNILLDARPIDSDAIWVVMGWSGTHKDPKRPEHPKGLNTRVYVKDGNVWKIRMESWGYAYPPPR